MNPEVQLMPSLPGVYKRLIGGSSRSFRKNEKGRESLVLPESRPFIGGGSSTSVGRRPEAAEPYLLQEFPRPELPSSASAKKWMPHSATRFG